jgi:ribosome-associated toxin RatA of RatAB toxin-antitoxin module
MAERTGKRQVEHQIKVLAPAERVYELIADVTQWPRIFPPTVHIEHVERGTSEERIRLWATANGAVKTWMSRRWLDAGARRVQFRQEVSQPPVAAMGGTWIVEPLTATECLVRLLHDYQAVDDTAENLAWIERAVDRNSNAELAALKSTAELGDDRDDLMMTFEDTVHIAGSARDVYEFIYDATQWARRLPHVARVSLVEDVPNIQLLEMDTRTKDGSVHTTTSVRICFPEDKIIYKQTVLPALMTVHTGRWLLEENAEGVTATSQHTVVIKPSAVASVLGAGKTVADARNFVRTALSTNSLATLGHARSFAEQRRR